MNKKTMSPEERLRWLCDFYVTGCVAVVNEVAPGAEYFDEPDADVMIQHLKQTPELTGVIIDGGASVRNPDILNDKLVFFNRTEEEVLKQLEEVPSHEQVHWMFNEYLKMVDEHIGKYRAVLPNMQMVYSIDSYNLGATTERMLRVIVQSATVKTSQTKKSLEEQLEELQSRLDGPGKLTNATLEAKLRDLQARHKKLADSSNKSELKTVEADIDEVKENIELIAQRERLAIQLKAYKEEKNEKRVKKAEADLIALQIKIATKENGFLKELNNLRAKREMVSGVAGKQDERDKLDEEVKKCTKKIEGIREKMANIQSRMAKLEKTFKNLREPKTSPLYQKRKTEHVRKLYKRYYALCEKHKVKLVTKPELMVFEANNDSFVIDYANDRGRTWQPMPGRVKKLAEAYHGTMENYRENVAETLKELGAKARDVDVIVESGHHGVFFARWQKQELTPEEVRLQHVNTYYTGESDDVKHMVYVACMPFEPQDKIAKYMKREKPGRTRASKMMGEIAHPVFVRNSKRSVSGLTILRKHNHGFISVEAIFYNLFRNKKVLEPFKAVMTLDDSDNHLNSPEMDCPGTLGSLVLMDHLMAKPIELYGQKVHLAGTKTLGDISEANSKKWKEAVKFRRPVMEMITEIASMIAGTDTSDPKSVAETALRWQNDMMGGANENMELNMRAVRWFLKEKFLRLYHNSQVRLRDVMAALEGNHFADAVRDVGLKEFALFREWLSAQATRHEDFPKLKLKPFSLKIMAGGEPQYFQPETGKEEMVVHLGGYSSARQGLIEKYGVGHDGKLLVQAPCRMGLTHEPNAILNKARNQNAHVIQGGHTHEFYVTADKSGDNEGRFIHQLGATQRVSATELYYGGLPRTFGLALSACPRPGRYWTMMIPMNHMRRIGEAQRMVETEAAVNKKTSAKKK